jgi:hypothetical protein
MGQTYNSRFFVSISLVVDLPVAELSLSLLYRSLEFVISDAKVLVVGTELLVLTTEFRILFYGVLELLNHGWRDGGSNGRLSACLSGCRLQNTGKETDARNHCGKEDDVAIALED